MMKNEQGFTLVELLVAGLLSIMVVWLAITSLEMARKNKRAHQNKGEIENSMATLADEILKLGRVAENCTKPASMTLECQISVVPGADPSFVRFRNGPIPPAVSTYTVVHERKKSATAPWISIRTYENISFLYLCNDDDMRNGTENCDQAAPQLINTRHVANLDAIGFEETPDGRFFRFKLVKRLVIPDSIEGDVDYQSAFFVRNPIGVGVLGYQWGSLN